MKGSDNVSEKEKQIAENIVKACELLPEGKKEFLLGYAEGVAAMAKKPKRKKKPDSEQQ